MAWSEDFACEGSAEGDAMCPSPARTARSLWRGRSCYSTSPVDRSWTVLRACFLHEFCRCRWLQLSCRHTLPCGCGGSGLSACYSMPACCTAWPSSAGQGLQSCSTPYRLPGFPSRRSRRVSLQVPVPRGLGGEVHARPFTQWRDTVSYRRLAASGPHNPSPRTDVPLPYLSYS